MAHQLPPLPYAYDALEPYISQEIMVLHHTKHHQAYINALNAAEASYAKTSTPKERIALQAALKFNGGGTSCSDRVLMPDLAFALHYVILSVLSARPHQSLALLAEHGSRQGERR